MTAQLSTPQPPARQPLRALEALVLLLEHRRQIAASVAVVTVLALVLSLLLPQWFRGTATVLPPKQPDLFGALGSVSSALRSLPGAVRLGTQRPAGYNYLAILNSRTAMEEVVRRYDLVTVYDVADSSLELAVKELRSNVSFEETSNDEIVISVLDRDPRRAADMANTLVDLLNEISIRMGTTEARNNRAFIELRVTSARAQLAEAEEELRRYQERSGLIITPEHSASLSAIGSLYAARTKKEVELAILLRQVTEENPRARQLRSEVAELARRIDAIPAAGMTSLRLYREVVIQQKILEFLVPLEEQARIDEQKDIPVVLVLDRAVPPEKKDRPKRVLIVLTAALLSTLSGVLAVLGVHAYRVRAAGAGGEGGRLQEVLHATLADVSFWRTRRGRG